MENHSPINNPSIEKLLQLQIDLQRQQLAEQRATNAHLAEILRTSHRLDVGERTEGPRKAETSSPTVYDESDLVTIKEAMGILNASRWKVDDMRRTGELRTIERNCRSKRLIRGEVEAARKWSVDKGKV